MAILHWKIQRITALLIIPIIIYLTCYLFNIDTFTYNEVREDIISPLGLTFIILSSFTIYIHSALGVIVVIEDYIHNMCSQKIAINISNTLHILLFVLTILAIFMIMNNS